MTDEQLRLAAHLLRPMLKPNERYALIVVEENVTDLTKAQCISTMPPSQLYTIVDACRTAEQKALASFKKN